MIGSKKYGTRSKKWTPNRVTRKEVSGKHLAHEGDLQQWLNRISKSGDLNEYLNIPALRGKHF